MFQLCRHILPQGTQCAGAAQHNRLFCHHHQKLHAQKRSSGLRSQIRTQTLDYGAIPVPTPFSDLHPPLELLFPEDRASIQINLYRIADYLARGLMDRPTATALMYGMQVCQTNLARKPLVETPAAGCPTSGRSDVGSRPVQRIILTPDGDEIAPPVEILEENEAEPIHHRACPCLLCAEKYRNWPGEEHHPDCQCGLCEEQEQGSGIRAQDSEPFPDCHPERTAEPRTNCHPGQAAELPTNCHPEQTAELPTNCHPERSAAESRDLQFAHSADAPSSAQPKVGDNNPDPCSLSPVPCPPRIARASALLSASTNRDTFNRPWSVAEYTFGDAIRRHEAQYAARAAAALAAGIEPPPYQPYVTGLIPPDTPEGLEDQKMQQQTNEYWAAHFRAQIAERPDLQRALAEEEQREEANETQITEARINQIQAKAEEFLCNLPALFFPHSSFRPIGTRRKTALDRL